MKQRWLIGVSVEDNNIESVGVSVEDSDKNVLEATSPAVRSVESYVPQPPAQNR
jgi:hypothetical protein